MYCVDYGRRVAYGTDVGVYFQTLAEGRDRTPMKVLDLIDVQQIDVLEEYQLLIILSGECSSGSGLSLLKGFCRTIGPHFPS